jgi:hypothetical protein
LIWPDAERRAVVVVQLKKEPLAADVECAEVVFLVRVVQERKAIAVRELVRLLAWLVRVR